jgi:hypothetical protein
MTGTVIGLLALHVSQPPAASNTLVIALGARLLQLCRT